MTLANGTIVSNQTLITSWMSNTTVYENITQGATVSLPCEQIKLSAVLGISLGIGIPILLMVICCIGCCIASNREYKHPSPHRVSNEKLITRDECTPTSSCTKTATTEVYAPTPTKVIPHRPIVKRVRHADEFLFDSSYIRRVATILDADYHVSRDTLDWLENNQLYLKRAYEVNKKEGMEDKKNAVILIHALLNTHFVTAKEKERLESLYPLECAELFCKTKQNNVCIV